MAEPEEPGRVVVDQRHEKVFKLWRPQVRLPSLPLPAMNLIHFLLLLAIVSILAAIIAPNFVRVRSRSRVTSCKSNLKNIGTAMEMYSTDNKGLYPKKISLIAPNYLKTIPTCPTAGRDTYSRGFVSSAKPDNYTVLCVGAYHTGSGVGPNYPQYTATHGLISM